MERFPVGGPKDPVYNFLRERGFVMSAWSDKHWTRADGVSLHLFGTGSMARILCGNELVLEDKLEDAVNGFEPLLDVMRDKAYAAL